MSNTEVHQSTCKSVFKNGKKTTTKAEFTKKWIEMINKIERASIADFSKK